MTNTVDEVISEKSFFSALEKASQSEQLIESFKEDVKMFKRKGIKVEYRRTINGEFDIYCLRTGHQLYGDQTIKINKGYDSQK